MNKEQILSSLKSLRDQLPQDIVNSNYVSVEQIMRDLINEEEEEKRVLNEVKSTPEVKRLSSDYRTINSDFEDYVEMLAANEKEIAYMVPETIVLSIFYKKG